VKELRVITPRNGSSGGGYASKKGEHQQGQKKFVLRLSEGVAGDNTPQRRLRGSTMHHQHGQKKSNDSGNFKAEKAFASKY
jgi:hypothetical protein